MTLQEYLETRSRCGKRPLSLTGEELAALAGAELRLDPGTETYAAHGVQPYYQLRGKRISREQAREVIRRTDSLLGRLALPGYVGSVNVPQRWFCRDGFPVHCGWSHPNGVIGCNGALSAGADFDRLLTELLRWRLAFPWLDLMIAVSRWDGRPDCQKEAMEEAKDLLFTAEQGPETRQRYEQLRRRMEYMEIPDFCENLVLGVCVRDGTIEFLSPEHAARRYRAYAAAYGEADSRIYAPEYYRNEGLLVCDNRYLLDCLSDFGLEETAARELLAELPGSLWLDSEFPRG